MHSSILFVACISQHALPGGVSAPGGSAPGGGLLQGGLLLGVSAPGVSVPGGLYLGLSDPGGSASGPRERWVVYPNMQWGRPTPLVNRILDTYF